jgi:hypothetical protein
MLWPLDIAFCKCKNRICRLSPTDAPAREANCHLQASSPWASACVYCHWIIFQPRSLNHYLTNQPTNQPISKSGFREAAPLLSPFLPPKALDPRQRETPTKPNQTKPNQWEGTPTRGARCTSKGEIRRRAPPSQPVESLASPRRLSPSGRSFRLPPRRPVGLIQFRSVG